MDDRGRERVVASYMADANIADAVSRFDDTRAEAEGWRWHSDDYDKLLYDLLESIL